MSPERSSVCRAIVILTETGRVTLCESPCRRKATLTIVLRDGSEVSIVLDVHEFDALCRARYDLTVVGEKTEVAEVEKR